MTEVRKALDKLKIDTMPLCRKCWRFHKDSCPKQYCRACGTEHLPNMPFSFDNCAQTPKFQKFYIEHKIWVKENTAKIFAQPDTDEQEEASDE